MSVRMVTNWLLLHSANRNNTDMPSFSLSPRAAYKHKIGEKYVRAVKKEAFEELNPGVLGDLAAKSQAIPPSQRILTLRHSPFSAGKWSRY